ncbi:hypothetical protein MASR2M8_04180 [Opitutaceae bacterium]
MTPRTPGAGLQIPLRLPFTNMNPQTKKIRDNLIKLRGQLWPDVTPEMIWHRRRSDGFITIPRTMPLLMVMMDALSKGRPVSSTYLELWCRSHDEAILLLAGKEFGYATASGFSGERAVSTWSSRLDILAKLGFIRLAPGAAGPRAYALLLNPYHAARQHRDKLEAFLWNTFAERTIEIRANDLEETEEASRPATKKKRS